MFMEAKRILAEMQKKYLPLLNPQEGVHFKLLTAKNPSIQHDINLLNTLSLNPTPLENPETHA